MPRPERGGPFKLKTSAILATTLAFLTAAAAAPVRAEIVERGGEFQANTYTTGAQKQPDVAALESGGYVVVWESAEQDGSADGIFMRRFNDGGSPIGTQENRVNANVVGPQRLPSVTSAGGDDSLVVWVDANEQQTRVAGRLFSGTTATSPEFQVSYIDEPYLSQRPAAAFQANGNFVVVWNAFDEFGVFFSNAVLVRRFTADGEPIAPSRRARELEEGELASPAVAATSEHNVVLVWSENQSVLGLRYNTQQDLFSNATFPVSTTEIDGETFPAIAADPQGNIVVAWENLGDVYARLFDSEQDPVSDEFVVNTTTTGTQERPSVRFDNNGGFIVAWTTFEKDAPGQDGSAAAVFAQRFDKAGERDGDEFQVNIETARSQQDPSIAIDSIGQVTIAWESQGQDRSGLGVFGRRFVVAAEGECGDPVVDDSGRITAADALFVLRSAVGTAACARCACDVDGNATITATDAVLALRMALDIPVSTACPPCAG